MSMKFLDEKVFAVLLASIIVASGYVFATNVFPREPEGFLALIVLDEQGGHTGYVTHVVIGENVSFHLVVVNMRGYTLLARIVYRITLNSTLPTSTKPSPEPVIREWVVAVPPYTNTTLNVRVPISYTPLGFNRSLALVFELWEYNTQNDTWVYTGIWVHILVSAEKPIIPP